MKLVRFSQNGSRPRLGCFLGKDRIMDLPQSCEAFLAGRGVIRAQAIAHALFPHDSMRGLLEGGVATQDMLAEMIDAVGHGTFAPASHPVGSVRPHAPSADPGKLIFIGRN